MKTTTVRLLLAAALALRAGTALAIVDFETTPVGGTPTNDGPIVGAYTDSGVQISFGFDSDSNGSVESPALFELFGTDQFEAPNIGFQGSSGADTADPGFAAQLGRWFLRSPTPFANFGRFVIQYSSTFPVTAAGGEIWDIDGQPLGPYTERYKIEAFDSANNSLGVLLSPVGTLSSPTAPLDGKPWAFNFSGLSAGIDRIDITFVGTKPDGIGLAFNNFYPTTNTVPEPASALLGGLVGCAFVWNRRRRAGTL